MNSLLKKYVPIILVALLTLNQVFSQEMQPNVESVKTFMVDKNATDTTAIMFYSLKKSAKSGVIIGQQDAFTGRNINDKDPEMTDMKATSGKHPLIIGLDFIFITDIKNTPGSWFEEQEKLAIQEAKNNYKRGMLSAFTWHFRNPYDYEWFSVDTKNSSQVSIAKKSLPSILKGGENHAYYKTVLKKIASVLGKLKDENGNLFPVIFRPYHEFDGGWFWWGKPYCTPQQFKDNWKFTVEYLRDSLGVHNIIYGFSPDNGFSTEAQFLERYPGDNYVDLVGMDNYSDFESNNISGASAKLKIISDYAKAHNKLAALTEAGYRNTPVPTDLFTKTYLKVLTTKSLELSYMMFWANSSTGYFVPPPTAGSAADFKSFVNDPYTLLQGDAQPIYSFPNVTAIKEIDNNKVKISYKNDTSGQTIFNIDIINNTEVSIQLCNSNGVVLQNKQVALKKGTNTLEFTLQQHGVYLAKFVFKDLQSNIVSSKTIKIAK